MRRRFLTSTVIVAALVAAPVLALGGSPGGEGPAAAAAAAKGKKKLKFKGKSKSGQAISFTIVKRGKKARIKGLAVDVVTECWADQDGDGASDKLVAHISGLDGRIYRDGTVEVFYSPDEDTEYVVDGKLTRKRARLNVVVGGYFGPDGKPNTGSLQCDNWGTIYRAKRR